MFHQDTDWFRKYSSLMLLVNYVIKNSLIFHDQTLMPDWYDWFKLSEVGIRIARAGPILSRMIFPKIGLGPGWLGKPSPMTLSSIPTVPISLRPQPENRTSPIGLQAARPDCPYLVESEKNTKSWQSFYKFLKLSLYAILWLKIRDFFIMKFTSSVLFFINFSSEYAFIISTFFNSWSSVVGSYLNEWVWSIFGYWQSVVQLFLWKFVVRTAKWIKTCPTLSISQKTSLSFWRLSRHDSSLIRVSALIPFFK